jgi:hypothetical protein
LAIQTPIVDLVTKIVHPIHWPEDALITIVFTLMQKLPLIVILLTLQRNVLQALIHVLHSMGREIVKLVRNVESDAPPPLPLMNVILREDAVLADVQIIKPVHA